MEKRGTGVQGLDAGGQMRKGGYRPQPALLFMTRAARDRRALCVRERVNRGMALGMQYT